MTGEKLNALRRAEAAERMTSPTGPKPAPGVYRELGAAGLVYWAPGWRLTDKGREALASGSRSGPSLTADQRRANGLALVQGLWLDAVLVKRLDGACKRLGVTRTALVAEALTALLR